MPWNERKTMTMKEELIQSVCEHKMKVDAICSQLGISRKTAYKWIARYKEEGVMGLQERSKRPLYSPNRIKSKIVKLVLQTRDKFPAWGGRKLKTYLKNEGSQDLPSEATINRLLTRHERVKEEDSNKRKHFIRFEKGSPNELWQMDFKGHFRVGQERCHPLTVLDDHSRYSICLQACTRETLENVQEALEKAFRLYGLPEAMTMDNGPPWKGSYPWHMSRLTIWLSRLGIKVGHSRPRHPQTQGKDERFHKSLKDEVLRFHQFQSIEETQLVFNEWRDIYNYKRPHEGISLARPGDRYQKSCRLFPETLPVIEYQENDLIRKVRSCGEVSYKGQDIFVGEHLKGSEVALRAYSEGIWDVYFFKTRVARFKVK